MIYRKLNKNDINRVMDLFCSSFYDDIYYEKMFPNKNNRKERMMREFTSPIDFCLENGFSLGVFNDSKLIAFIITVDYQMLYENKDMYNSIFAIDIIDDNYEKKIKLKEKLQEFADKTLFLLSLAIEKQYRKKGLASSFIEYLIKSFPDYNLIADVSNPNSLNMYVKRRFNVEQIADEYYFVSRRAMPYDGLNLQTNSTKIALSSSEELDHLGIKSHFVSEKYIMDIKISNFGYFIEKKGEIELAKVYEISYQDLLQYQKHIGVSSFTEKAEVDFLYYVCNADNYVVEQYSEEYESFLEKREVERKICPDIFVSIPVSYVNSSLFEEIEGDELSKAVLKNLDFRTKYEAGIISTSRIEKGNCAFKNRIKRRYLGKIKIKNCGENSLDNYDDYYLIGTAYYVDIYVSYDELSKSAVIGLYSMSCPFLTSLFFDNIIRNQVIVVDIDEEGLNLFDYLEQKYAIKKSGSPKIYSVIPEDRDIMASGQIGALLSGEMIYEDGENFGRIIDSDIIGIVESQLGMGQYNRGCVLAYMNVVLQFDKHLKGLLVDRVAEEIITQFYIELVMFEESAINSTNDSITDLLGNPSFLTPVEYLKAVEKIQDDYSKTMCFWSITLNYPTSQKSIEMLRDAFRIEKQLDKLERNKTQLEEVFDTKNDIIDRTETKRVDTSLAVLSVLAIFSALIDCFDFIGVWQRFISEKVILGLQIFSSIAIIIVGVYVVLHITRSRLLTKLKKRKNK